MRSWCPRGLLSLVALFGLTMDAQAFGKRAGSASCEPGCAVAPCDSAPCAAPCESAVAECAVPAYTEQVVTRYRQVMVEKEVEVVVCRQVPREEKFTYE